MLARIAAFVMWALVAGSVMFWALRLVVSSPQAPLNALAVGATPALRGDLARVLGSAPSLEVAEVAAPEASSRFRLVGVMAPLPRSASAPSQQGVALIAVDGKPARAFAVGSKVDGEVVLQSVSQRAVSIGNDSGQVPIRLELPALPPPSTGTLPGLGAVPGAAVPAFAPPPAMPQAPPAAVPGVAQGVPPQTLQFQPSPPARAPASAQ